MSKKQRIVKRNRKIRLYFGVAFIVAGLACFVMAIREAVLDINQGLNVSMQAYQYGAGMFVLMLAAGFMLSPIYSELQKIKYELPKTGK